MKRRAFLQRLYRLVWAIWGMIGLWGVRRYLSPREGLGSSLGGFWIRAGKLEELPPGKSRLIPLGERAILLIRPDEERLVAFSAFCTHLRCGLKWNPETRQILCPCHGARFDLHGNVLQGPPRRPLPRYSVRVQNGTVLVRREAV